MSTEDPHKNEAAARVTGDSESSGLGGLTEAVELGPAVPGGDPMHDPLIGMDLGGVKLIRLIAEGGMGRVYEGLQDKPRRTVAVKVMRPGFVSPEVTRRFDNEAEVLGRLRHRYIAQIFSAGICNVAGARVPYFVMEYIPNALSITKYVAHHKLPTDERLALFRKVCDAVAHGHEIGVIHRDLKPSNILVEPSGEPKIIDFGVAKCGNVSQEAMTALTDMGQLIGTVQYMSPEQFAANPVEIDVRADVYALGVILYELLTGKPPYEIRQKQIFEAARVVREQKPISPEKLNKTVRPDVAKITGRCLAKDRSRRYANAAEVATAIGSYLSGQPVPELRRVTFSEMLGFNRVVARFRSLAAAPGSLGKRRFASLATAICLGTVILGATSVIVWNGGLGQSEEKRLDPIPPPPPPPVVIKSAPATDFKYEVKGNSVTITGYLGNDPVVVIPAVINGRPVTIIGNDAFNGQAAIRSVVLPASVEGIGNAAFCRCSSMESISMPDNLVGIGFDAFHYCKSLKSIDLPARVSHIVGDGYCFRGSSGLKRINVDMANMKFASVDGVLYDKGLTTLILCPAGKEGRVIVPSTVTKFLGTPFADCSRLTHIAIPDRLKDVNESLFNGCDAVIETIP